MKILRYFSPKNPLVRAVAFPLLLTATVLTFVCAVFGLYPFGDGSLCWCDMRQQGLPLLMMLRNALLSGESLSYMPGLTGGADFAGVAAFFLWNPGSLLSVFWKAENLLDLLNLLVFGKLLLCAATAGWFFYRRFPQNGVGIATAFSTAYALCGYGLLYYQNLMWLDVMALFPLFLLACYALLEQGRPLPYILLMTACMATCFYIGFMVAIFALLFFGVHLFTLRKNRRRTAVQFLLGSFSAALLSAFVWLPSLWQVVHSARGTYLPNSLITCSWSAPFATSLPLLLCSAGVPALLLVTFLFHPKWNRKTVSLAVLCALLLIPMVLEPINRMWHMGSYMCFPCRFGFMPILLMLTLVAHLWSYSPLPQNDRRPMRIWSAVFCGVVTVSAAIFLRLVFSKNSDAATVYIRTLWGDSTSLRIHLLAFAVIAGAVAVWAVFYRLGWFKKTVAPLFLCGLILCESVFYTSLYIGKVPNYWQYNRFEKIVDLSDKTEGDTFTRVKTTGDLFDSNMIGAIGYPSLGGYTSLVNEDTLYTAKKLGYTANWMDIGLNGGTRFSDALLSVGYTVNQRYGRYSGNSVLYSNDTFRLEQIRDTLPFGLLVNDAVIASAKELPDGDRISVQEELAKTLFNKPNLITRHTYFSKNCEVTMPPDGGANVVITGEEPAIVYTVYVNDTVTLYLDCFDGCSTRVNEPIFNSFSVTVNGLTVANTYPNSHESGFLDLGYYQNGDVVTIVLTPLKNVHCSSFGLFSLHQDVLDDIVTSASSAGLSYDGHAYTGSFTADEHQNLLLTLPYSDGYKAIVNGHRRPIQKLLGNYCAIVLTPGETAVKITYTPPGRTAGWILTILGILLLVLVFKFRQRIDAFLSPHKALIKNSKKVAFITAIAATSLCFVTVYLFPLVFKLLNL